jgi:hypothetical protein
LQLPLLFLLSSPKGICFCLCYFSPPKINFVISTEAAHSFIMSIAAEKSAFAVVGVAAMPLLILLSF